MLVNISRRNSLILGLGIIILFFSAGIIMLLSSNVKNSAVSPVEEKQLVVEEIEKPNLAVPITMNRFERHETRNGKKVWEVTAEKGRYLPQQNSAELEQSKLLFYRDDDSVIKLSSSHAKIVFSGTELKKAEVFGGVELIYNDKLKISSESATYDKSEDKVFIPGEVNISSENVDLRGKELTANISKQEVVIGRDVSTIIKPKDKK